MLRVDGESGKDFHRAITNLKQLAVRYGWMERERLTVVLELCSELTHDAIEFLRKLPTLRLCSTLSGVQVRQGRSN